LEHIENNLVPTLFFNLGTNRKQTKNRNKKGTKVEQRWNKGGTGTKREQSENPPQPSVLLYVLCVHAGEYFEYQQ
jgi:hypothetical protein